MFNLIKMNLYRMKNAVSSWVLGICAVAAAVLNFVILKITLDDPFNLGIADAIGNVDVSASGTCLSFLRASMMMIILAIFVVIFSNAEQKCGFDKNIIGITKMKWKHPLARWISALIGGTILMLVGLGTNLGLCALFLKAFSFGDVVPFLKGFGVVYVFYAAFTALFFFFTTAFRNSAGGIVASLVITTGVFSLVEQLLDMGFMKLFHNPKFLPSDFLIDTVYNSMDLSASNGKLIRYCAIAVVYLVVCVGAAMFMQQKRDVK